MSLLSSEKPDQPAMSAPGEADVLSRQQQGILTIREAAGELGLTYEAYLELLACKGLPASSDDTDESVFQAIKERLRP